MTLDDIIVTNSMPWIWTFRHFPAFDLCSLGHVPHAKIPQLRSTRVEVYAKLDLLVPDRSLRRGLRSVRGEGEGCFAPVNLDIVGCLVYFLGDAQDAENT